MSVSISYRGIFFIFSSGTVTNEPHHQPEPTQTEADQSQKEAAESAQPAEKGDKQSEGDSWFSSWGVSNISNMVQKSVSIECMKTG